MATYQHHDGAIWRWSKRMDGTPFCVWVHPQSAIDLLALHAADPATAHLADELRAALIEQQTEATEAA